MHPPALYVRYYFIARQELAEFFTLSQFLPLEHIRPLSPLFPPLPLIYGNDSDVSLGGQVREDKNSSQIELDQIPLLGMSQSQQDHLHVQPLIGGKGAKGGSGGGGRRGSYGTSDAGSSAGSQNGDADEEVTVNIHGQEETLPARQVAELRSKLEDLEDLVPESSLVGGKTFKELTLYEKKSVLIDRELE